MGEAGIRPQSIEYMKEVRKICDEFGILMFIWMKFNAVSGAQVNISRMNGLTLNLTSFARPKALVAAFRSARCSRRKKLDNA